MRLEPPARAVVLAGFMGTGKSAVGAVLADHLGLQLVETDDLLEQAAGRSIPEVFAQEGEEAFRDRETEAVRRAAAMPGVVLSTGGGALLREENLRALREAGPIVALQASPETIHRRTCTSDYRPLLGEDPRARIAQLLAERAEAYAQTDYTVATDDQSPQGVAQRVADLMVGDPRAVYLTGQPLPVPVEVPGAAYTVWVGQELLARAGELVPAEAPGAVAVITSDRLREPYGERVAQGLAASGWQVSQHTVPDGEGSKRLAVAEQLCQELVQAGHDRGSWVFAVGGGVICDLAGLVAAIYMRGIPSVTVPTSLLAQVDAAVGGKVAVDLPQGKNLVGAFHQPRAVVADVSALATLPARAWGEGLAEIIKHAALADAELFVFLERELTRVRGGEAAALTYVVGRNCQIKAEVVAADPRDTGGRAVLNLGHTVGHALERAAAGWTLGHGEAVAVGMVAETRWAQERGLAAAGTAERLAALLRQAGLATAAPPLDWGLARAALRADKKVRRGQVTLPVLSRIGQVRLVDGVGVEELETALELVRL